jgi:hypothetical protein
MEDTVQAPSKSKEEVLAKIISYLFHPLFMPTYGMALLFFSNALSGFNPYALPEIMHNNLLIFAVVIALTLVAPGVSAILLKRMGKIQSLQMKTRQERQIPFAITGFCYLAAYTILQNALQPVNHMVLIVLAGAQLAILIALIVSAYWKVSLHMMGIGGILGMEILMVKLFHMPWEILLYGTVLLAGFVGFARLRLNAHEPLQVLVGFVIGVLTETLFLLAY